MHKAAALAQPEASQFAAAVQPTDSAESLAAELAVSAALGLSLARTAEARQTIDRLRSDSEAFAEVNLAAAEAPELTGPGESDDYLSGQGRSSAIAAD